MTAAIQISAGMLAKEEGFRAKPYYCSEDYVTIGYGEKIGGKYEPLPDVTTTEPEAYRKMLKMIEVNEKNTIKQSRLIPLLFSSQRCTKSGYVINSLPNRHLWPAQV